ncbi:Uncharacterised protein [Mycobacteroides abscessus subsp. abscessus]|nr:Uncharacterised protein [Mycobacteroides abscessus subsp. abscessus]
MQATRELLELSRDGGEVGIEVVELLRKFGICRRYGGSDHSELEPEVRQPLLRSVM